jgi:signal transduction histidine kinase
MAEAPDSLRLTRRAVGLVYGLWLAALVVSYGAEALARTISETAQVGVGPEFLWVPPLDAVLWTLVTLAGIALTRRFPLDRGRWLRHGLVLLAAGLAVIPARNVALVALVSAGDALRSDVDFGYLFVSSVRDDLFVWGLVVFAVQAVRHAQRLREREVAQAHVEAELAEAQLQTLKGQLQPHFLFNTLHAIATLVHDDPPRAGAMVEDLSELLRSSLAHHEAQEVPLKDEVGTLRPYLAIEQTRLGDRLGVAVDVAPEAEGALVPHLLLQPLVENAVRHGIAPRRGPGTIRVEAHVEGGEVRLVVEDDGLGMNGPIRPGAIGLANTRARLAHLYGDAHRFAIDSAPGEGTRVEIALPLRAVD